MEHMQDILDWSKKRIYQMLLSVMSMQLWNEIKKSILKFYNLNKTLKMVELIIVFLCEL